MSTRRTRKAVAVAAPKMETEGAVRHLTPDEIAAIKAPGVTTIEVEEERPFFHAVRSRKLRPIEQAGQYMDDLARSVEGV